MDSEKLLRELVADAIAFRNTAIVDDDFPAMRDRFDSTLERARRFLQQEARDRPRDYFRTQHT